MLLISNELTLLQENPMVQHL